MVFASMCWSNILLIFHREVRDQLRDRRTIFMIVVLPILLYPLLGLGIVKLTLAFEQKPRTVILLGAEHLPAEPPLLNAGHDGFDPSLFDSEAEAARLRVEVQPEQSHWTNPMAQRVGLRGGLADAVVTVPADIHVQIQKLKSPDLPVAYDSANERSQITYLRVREVIERWRERIVSRRLKEDNKPAGYIEPVRVKAVDVATRAESGGSVWARIFPFLLVMMALTGAFYPAVDLCAGEKERGTMETLLISPASRTEIVLGKFLTVMLASVATALLNLASMGLTGLGLAYQLSALTPVGGPRATAAIITPPTLASACWMLVLLIPLSAFFSAVCLALAVLAKSMKEGQYYMTPLYLVSLPLIFMTLAPGIELNLFYSLVPITGVSLLLRALMQGEYSVARVYFLPVLVPTLVYAAVALRWAIDQFQRESVLFREAERFDLRAWVRHLFRDKEPMPTPGEALLCFVLMLSSAWLASQFGFIGTGPVALAAGQVAFILAPPLAMGFLLTSDPRRTLRLTWPQGRYMLLGAGLALAMNPLVNELKPLVEYAFPIRQDVRQQLEGLMRRIGDPATALLLLAVIPAICEEIAFRGYILSGLERVYRPRSAIVLSALLFGFLHVLLSLFQQLFNATLLGLVLGLLAYRSGSLVPGILFHFLNNGLAILTGLADNVLGDRITRFLYRNPAEGLYHWPWVALGALVSLGLLRTLLRTDRATERAKGVTKAREPLSALD
jgi:sodium transport system permease protein